MKKIFVLNAIMAINSFLYSQEKNIKVLIGYKDTEIIEYLDSLNNVAPNGAIVKKSVSVYGDQIITMTFDNRDEEKMNCNEIKLVFGRVEGIEWCVKQSISGRKKYCFANLNYIKDNFKYIKPNFWETLMNRDDPTNSPIIIATFDASKSENFTISYDIKIKE